MKPELQTMVAASIARVGVRETAKRLGCEDETALRLAVPGARVRRGSVALAEMNAHKLLQAEAIAPR
jgi:hypothetical protein